METRVDPQYIEDRINKALAGSGVQVYQCIEGFDVQYREARVPLHIVDYGAELELLREKAPLHYLYEATARDFPSIARELVAAVKRLEDEGIIEDTDIA